MLASDPRDVRLLGRRDADYPRALTTIPDPPEQVWVRGRDEVLFGLSAGLAVAVVGSRDATAYGLSMAGRIAAGLAGLGIPVVSGLARGIDAAAHRAALESGGMTVAVLGAGVDRIYPREHCDLAERVAARGLVMTEFPPGTPPLGHHFLRRNRIISGLTLAVVVVEAAERSGALVTARLAGEQGREVFAVPGPAGASRSAGPHRLLREGAGLVESVQDLIDALPPLQALVRGKSALRPPPAGADSAASGEGRAVAGILRALDEGPHTLDALVAELSRPVSEISSEITSLELSGSVARGPGGQFFRTGRGPSAGASS